MLTLLAGRNHFQHSSGKKVGKGFLAGLLVNANGGSVARFCVSKKDYLNVGLKALNPKFNPQHEKAASTIEVSEEVIIMCYIYIDKTSRENDLFISMLTDVTTEINSWFQRFHKYHCQTYRFLIQVIFMYDPKEVDFESPLSHVVIQTKVPNKLLQAVWHLSKRMQDLQNVLPVDINELIKKDVVNKCNLTEVPYVFDQQTKLALQASYACSSFFSEFGPYLKNYAHGYIYPSEGNRLPYLSERNKGFYIEFVRRVCEKVSSRVRKPVLLNHTVEILPLNKKTDIDSLVGDRMRAYKRKLFMDRTLVTAPKENIKDKKQVYNIFINITPTIFRKKVAEKQTNHKDPKPISNK